MLAVLALITATVGGWIVYQNTYALREEQVTIAGATQPLHGVLALPEHGNGPFGLVVFVHGDGPQDATGETFYRPMWESFAAAGYASLSWDKPGINGAPGDWLDQSMDDRAAETHAAIRWARARPDIDAARIGVWGASQAGWVLPKVAAQDPGLQFMIVVSPRSTGSNRADTTPSRSWPNKTPSLRRSRQPWPAAKPPWPCWRATPRSPKSRPPVSPA